MTDSDLFENAVRCGTLSADWEALAPGAQPAASMSLAQYTRRAVRGALAGLLANGYISLVADPPDWYQPAKRVDE